MNIDSILWRRLDAPGHDICRLDQRTNGWELNGMAIFRRNGFLTGLTYHVACDPEWRTLFGRIQGWSGKRSIRLSISRSTTGIWIVDGAKSSGLENCVDLDLGFTPATNLLPVRRLDLSEGQAADAPAAWLDLSSGTLAMLPQRYARRTEDAYWYEAPTLDYAALLEVNTSGFIRKYPGLWEAEP